MNERFRELRARRDGFTVPAIHVALAVSVLIHAAALWKWMPQVRFPSFDPNERADARGPMTVQLAPPKGLRSPAAPAAPPQQSQRRQAPAPRLPRAVPQKQTAPPVLALKKPAPRDERRSPAVTAPAPSSPAQVSREGDLASYIEARRRARAESPAAAPAAASAPTVEDENARANRIAAANLGVGRKPTFGGDSRKGGGVFGIERMTYDYAEFLFHGWNKDIRRNTTQLIEVRKGGHSDIRIAVVRSMIAIIREHEEGDFVWESRRLGRNVTLSARPRDNAGLETFMMNEFFDEPRQPPLSPAP